MKDNKLIVCEHCGILKVQYVPKYNLCQTCYRKLLEEYSYYEIKEEYKENVDFLIETDITSFIKKDM